MLSTCILSKSITGRVISPYKWLKITVRLNSQSSSSSSDSSSDSDSDSDANTKQKQAQKGIKKDETDNQSADEIKLMDILQDMLNKTPTSQNINVTAPFKKKASVTDMKNMPFEKQLAAAAGNIVSQNIESKIQSESDVTQQGSSWKKQRREDSIIMKLTREKMRTKGDVTQQDSPRRYESRESSIIFKLAKERAQTQNGSNQDPSKSRESTESRKSIIAELAKQFENDLVQRLVPPKSRIPGRQREKYIDQREQDHTQTQQWESKRSIARSLLKERNADSRNENTAERPHDRFSSKQLTKGIQSPLFKDMQEPATDIPRLEIWDILEEADLKLSVKQYPANGFQELIQLTEEGKIWKFPIDNEQGMDEEYQVHFSKHVFTENYIKDWCPKKGPIRHFMELVCVGLSKNPYMTVEEKVGHIMWYKKYFEDKKELLLELGAVETFDFPDKPAQIEAK